ncbi:MAG TPA: hypothetical protein VF921_15475 [Vicinamibacterales bacterium]
MRILAGLAALAVIPALAGRAVRPVANAGIAWVFGFLVVSLAFALLHAARVPQAAAYAAIPVIAAMGGLAGGRWSGARTGPLPRLWTALVTVFALCMALETIWLPVDQWDAVALWYARARGLMQWRPLSDFALPAYPDVGPSAWALMLTLTGVGNEPIARLVFPAVCVAWVSSLPLLFEHRGRAWRRPAVVVLFLIAVATFDFEAATSGYQDPLVCAVAGIAAILLGRALLTGSEPPRRGQVALGFFFAGSLGMIKLEGGFLGAVMIASWIVTFAATRGWRALRAAVSGGAIALYAGLALLWPIIARLAGIDLTHAQGLVFEEVSARRLVDGVRRLPEIARGFADVTPTYSLVFLSAIVASLGAWRARWTRPILSWLWAVAAVHTAWITSLFMLTNVDLAWHINTALLRLVSEHAFVWVLALAVSVVAVFDDYGRCRTSSTSA